MEFVTCRADLEVKPSWNKAFKENERIAAFGELYCVQLISARDGWQGWYHWAHWNVH